MTEPRSGRRRSWAEPFKIKMVEPLRMTTREEREVAIREAGYNTFLLRSEDVYIDLLTDSGTSAMSDRQWAGMMLGDEAYAGSRNFYHLEAAIQEIYGYKHIVPTHQGRGAEHLLSQTLIKPGDVIPGNMYFTTTRLHQELAGGRFVDVIIDEAHDPASEHPFKGDVDLAKLQQVIDEVGAEHIPYVCIATAVNMAGGQPICLANLQPGARALREARHPHHPRRHARGRERLLHQGARARLRGQVRGRDRARDLRPHRRLHDERQEGRARQHRRLPGAQRVGGLRGLPQPGRRLRRPAHLRRHGRPRHGGRRHRPRTRASSSTTSRRASARSGTSARSCRPTACRSCVPIGGHGVFLDAKAFLPHLDQDAYPAQTLAAELYLDSGVRAMERGIVSAGRDPETGQNRHPQARARAPHDPAPRLHAGAHGRGRRVGRRGVRPARARSAA